jgi:hypothetical protein
MHRKNLRMVVVLSALIALSLSACGSGNQAVTRLSNQLTDGVDGSITSMGNAIKARDFLLVAQPDGSAVVVGTLVNDGTSQDSLLAMAGGQVIATMSEKSFNLIQNHPIIFSGTSANASAIIPGLNALPGTRIKMRMFFSIAGELTLDVLVREKAGIYSEVGP